MLSLTQLAKKPHRSFLTHLPVGVAVPPQPHPCLRGCLLEVHLVYDLPLRIDWKSPGTYVSLFIIEGQDRLQTEKTV